MALAGFSSGEAEGLRRAMSRKRSEAALRAYRDRFVGGAVGRGVSRPTAEKVFRQIQGFSGFGFPKAHSVAFGLLAYQSAWLRVHYGPEFLSSLLNEQPMGFYPPDALVHEAQRRGDPGPARRRQSQPCPLPGGGCRGRSPALSARCPHRARLRQGSEGGGDAGAGRGARARRQSYGGIADLASRSGVSRDGLERLAWAGAMDSIAAADAKQQGTRRRGAYWRLGTLAGSAATGAGTQLALPLEPPRAPELPGPRPLGEGRRGLRVDRDDPRRSPRGAAATRAPRCRPQLRPGTARRRARGRGGGDGRRPSAPGDGEGGLLRPARGRARDDQPGGPAPGLRAFQGNRPHRAAAPRRGRLERRQGAIERGRLPDGRARAA